jgi:hypothetical protein
VSRRFEIGDDCSARLPVEGTGFIAGDVEFYVFLVDALITIHAVLFRIIPHYMIPPVKQRVDFSLIDRIAEIASRVFLDHASGDIVDLTVAFQGIEHEKQSGFVVVELVDAGVNVRFDGQHVLGRDMMAHEKKAQTQTAACDE